MKNRPLSPAERRDWLRLARTEQVGPITFRQLLRRFGSAKAALEALPDLARRGGTKRTPSPPPHSKIDDEIAALESRNGRFIALCEPDYPEALAAIEDAPPVLAVFGQSEVLNKRGIGIVGARNASLNGRKMAERLAHDLGREGLIIISGMARGIDTAAHQASLATGTVAVLAGGADVVYPEENRGLYEKIINGGGAVLSDQPMGCEPRAQLFPRRNRLISGLSLGVIVVEAAKQSGSLITARLALEQGREVFAVPGSPLDPRANGTNDLLRQGAVLTENAADVLNHIHALSPLFSSASGFEEPPFDAFDEREMDAARAKILENLSPSPVSVDELIRQCQMSPAPVLTILLELELAGRLERQPGHMVALVL
ncbi:MAG: DNA-processing protein DprA [Alphaproteobacteria bacterium]|nr:DNA-processing protein DprA [Alphaproteobacteria bacterium]